MCSTVHATCGGGWLAINHTSQQNPKEMLLFLVSVWRSKYLQRYSVQSGNQRNTGKEHANHLKHESVWMCVLRWIKDLVHYWHKVSIGLITFKYIVCDGLLIWSRPISRPPSMTFTWPAVMWTVIINLWCLSCSSQRLPSSLIGLLHLLLMEEPRRKAPPLCVGPTVACVPPVCNRWRGKRREPC